MALLRVCSFSESSENAFFFMGSKSFFFFNVMILVFAFLDCGMVEFDLCFRFDAYS